jgi:hypothetical protein
MTPSLTQLFSQARAELASGSLAPARLDELERSAVQPCASQLRQRLLYLHAAHPSIRSPLINASLHEPVAGSVTQIDPTAPELPYQTVHDAIVDGWRVVSFPPHRMAFDDREVDILGYEFILEKLVTV